ncbi:MAG: beta-ketoacyl-ACP reductase [Polaromonas sp.]|nr:beta-ketoacyl-ACP reductase [Polaromonas sp.]
MTIQLPLAGRAALLTGGTRNIGRALALALASDGAAVSINSRRYDDDARLTVKMIEDQGGRAMHVQADVSDEAEVLRMVDETVTKLGSVDILVHCAGIRRVQALQDISLKSWREVMGTNLDAAFLCSKAVVPHMQKGMGRIVFLSGVSAFKGAPERAHVVASKAGLVGLARALATELADRQITVNCIAPGHIDTVRGVDAGAVPSHLSASAIPLGRLGKTSEVAAMTSLLASDSGAFITGQVLHVNGGLFFGA